MTYYTCDAIYSVVSASHWEAFEVFVRYQGGGGLATSEGCVYTSIIRKEARDKGGCITCTVRFSLSEYDGAIGSLLSYLMGMLPLFPGVVLRHVELGGGIIEAIAPLGPALGQEGVYSLLSVSPGQTLFGAILKPPQLRKELLEPRVLSLLRAGVDVVKDDDLALGSLPFVSARLDVLAQAVSRGVEERSRAALLLLYADGALDNLLRVAQLVAQRGPGFGLMVAPGFVGFDSIHAIRQRFPGLPIALHTAGLPACVHLSVYLGLLGSLVGGDILILPVPEHFGIDFTQMDVMAMISNPMHNASPVAEPLVALGGGIAPASASYLCSLLPKNFLVLCGSWATAEKEGLHSAFTQIRRAIGR